MERECVCACVRVRERVCVCVCACVERDRVCMRVCVSVCLRECVRTRERERVCLGESVYAHAYDWERVCTRMRMTGRECVRACV
jgi:hypothetical protein